MVLNKDSIPDVLQQRQLVMRLRFSGWRQLPLQRASPNVLSSKTDVDRVRLFGAGVPSGGSSIPLQEHVVLLASSGLLREARKVRERISLSRFRVCDSRTSL